MNSEISDLYQQVILDHYRSPRGSGTIENATHKAFANNPLCGDEVAITARVSNGVIEDVKHESVGCAICVASASIMVEQTVGKSVSDFAGEVQKFYSFAKGEGDEVVGKLQAFAGVSKFPMRVKCATLAWHTLEEALKSK